MTCRLLRLNFALHPLEYIWIPACIWRTLCSVSWAFKMQLACWTSPYREVYISWAYGARPVSLTSNLSNYPQYPNKYRLYSADCGSRGSIAACVCLTHCQAPYDIGLYWYLDISTPRNTFKQLTSTPQSSQEFMSKIPRELKRSMVWLVLPINYLAVVC